MNRMLVTACLVCIFGGAIGRAAPAAPCGPCATTCTPRWEDKKTKKPQYSHSCSPACVRGFDPWCDHGCCPEDTPPCGLAITKKKLYKRDEDKVERVLKYEVGDGCVPCPLPSPTGCGPRWYDLPGHCRRLLGLW